MTSTISEKKSMVLFYLCMYLVTVSIKCPGLDFLKKYILRSLLKQKVVGGQKKNLVNIVFEQPPKQPVLSFFQILEV
jgi:hypothetical protein